MSKEKVFTPYQVFIITILAVIQFSIVLDFMVLSPLGFLLMEKLKITPAQFATVVSAYAFSASVSGLLAAGFADKFDRKKFLLFFYTGFVGGTFFCAMAPTYELLLIARIVTGIFGGVLGSVSMAIITDLFKMEVRGRVMGFTQMAFAASQVLGLPIGLLLANKFSWHAPFWMIGIFAGVVGLVVLIYMKPVTGHLNRKMDKSPFHHLWSTVKRSDYLQTFLAMMLMATGGFMLMPFGSDFSTHNLGLKADDLPLLYGVTGIFSMIFGPLIGKASDKIGKFNTFVAGSVVTLAMVLIYVRLGVTPFWMVAVLNVVMFAGITGRIIAASSLMTAVPDAPDRGAFMSINSSMQQFAGGVASYAAGLIVFKDPKGNLQNYPLLGWVVMGAMIVVVVMLYTIDQMVKRKLHKAKV